MISAGKGPATPSIYTSCTYVRTFYETQDLSSPNEKPKLLFYDYSWHFFFSSQSPRGTLYVLMCHSLLNISLAVTYDVQVEKNTDQKLDCTLMDFCHIHSSPLFEVIF